MRREMTLGKVENRGSESGSSSALRWWLAGLASLLIGGTTVFAVAAASTESVGQKTGESLAPLGPFTSKGTQPPLTNTLLVPSDCSSCHGDYDSGRNIEPFPTWQGSMMANSSRDPLFWAALDVANNDLPGVGDYCLRCHVPSGWLAGRSEPPGGSVDGCGLLGRIDEVDNDFSGVSCHLCHRMMVNPSPPMGEDPVYFENAQFWIDDGDCTSPGSGPCRRGPYDYPPGGDPPPTHEWAFSQYHVDSDICGNCHNVTSPANTLIDENGIDTGLPYPIERTFKEWQQSDFGDNASGSFQTCQNCHMPDATGVDSFACIFQQTDRNGNMGIHQFVGGNSWMPAVMKGEYPNLNRDAAFDATTAWALDMLQNQSAVVELTTPSGSAPGDTLEFDVKVTNLTGHKLPTGYTEGRRMWLNVEVRDAGDALVWESGAYDLATGVLTEDAQAKIYQTERGQWDLNSTGECDVVDGGGNHLFHFVLNDCIRSDNRIPPAGFTGMGDLETQPVAYSYPETAPGSGKLVNFDVTAYQVPIPLGTASPVSVQARLYYQTMSKEYVEFLRDEAVTNGFPDDCIERSGGSTPMMSRGELMYDIWTRYDRSPPVEMDADSGSVDITLDVFADGFESGNVNQWSAVVP